MQLPGRFLFHSPDGGVVSAQRWPEVVGSLNRGADEQHIRAWAPAMEDQEPGIAPRREEEESLGGAMLVTDLVLSKLGGSSS